MADVYDPRRILGFGLNGLLNSQRQKRIAVGAPGRRKRSDALVHSSQTAPNVQEFPQERP